MILVQPSKTTSPPSEWPDPAGSREPRLDPTDGSALDRAIGPALPTGPWGRPLRPAHSSPPGTGVGGPPPSAVALLVDGLPGAEPAPFRPTRPPPRSPVELSPLARSPRRWIIEAVVAAVALTCCALAVHPTVPATPDPFQVWSERAGPQLVNLGTDIAELQQALVPSMGQQSPSRAGSGAQTLAVRLGKDVARARSLASPPGVDRRRIWASALSHGSAAVQTLTGRAGAPTSARVESARADLELAGDDLVAVTQGGLPGAAAH